MKALRLAPLFLFPLLLVAQQTDLLNSLKFRQIGPFRGGRSVAVAGVPSQPDTYYFGAVGGGVFKTTDSGLTWVPVSDGQFKTGSVGALAVADSDPNVIYAGMGEACVRGNATHGDGVYKIGGCRPHLAQCRPARTATTSARCACIRRIPTSSTWRRWGICGGRTKCAASTAPPMAAPPGSRC